MSGLQMALAAVERWMERSFQARRWSRAWKKAAKLGALTGEALCVLQNVWAEQGARIAKLEETLRHAADTLQDAGLPNSAGCIRELLEKP